MNRIEELEKQIKAMRETTEKKAKELQKEIDKLKDNSIPRRKFYSYIDIDLDGNFYVDTDYDGITTKYYDNWNYFTSVHNASNFLDILNELKTLQHYHDVYCPLYEPNWNDSEEKWYIVFNKNTKEYLYDCSYNLRRNTIYFDSEETVRKVCNKMNKNL